MKGMYFVSNYAKESDVRLKDRIAKAIKTKEKASEKAKNKADSSVSTVKFIADNE